MTTITFKVTDDEARLLRSLAKKEHVSVSEYLRRRTTVAAPAGRKREIPRRLPAIEVGR